MCPEGNENEWSAPRSMSAIGGLRRSTIHLTPTMPVTARSMDPARSTGRHQCVLRHSHTSTVARLMRIIPVGAVTVVITTRTDVTSGSRCS